MTDTRLFARETMRLNLKNAGSYPRFQSDAQALEIWGVPKIICRKTKWVFSEFLLLSEEVYILMAFLPRWLMGDHLFILS